jgi:hypothetical protein
LNAGLTVQSKTSHEHLITNSTWKIQNIIRIFSIFID